MAVLFATEGFYCKVDSNYICINFLKANIIAFSDVQKQLHAAIANAKNKRFITSTSFPKNLSKARILKKLLWFFWKETANTA